MSLLASENDKSTKTNIEVCFTFDTTGSMSGLIDGAKSKIWSIANNIVSLRPQPNVKFCLLAYRDRKDVYITKFTDLTDDMEHIYKQLMTFNAAGGGDGPESVNQALKESVVDISWSTDVNTLRIIYLVGDFPPHMDYEELQYPQISDLAKQKDITINTIQCGDHQATAPVWKEIAKRTNGFYSKLLQHGNTKTIHTPLDQDFVALNTKLNETHIAYGASQQKNNSSSSRRTTNENESIVADRTSFFSKIGFFKNVKGDLIEDRKRGLIDLEKITDNELPTQLKGLSFTEKQTYLAKVQALRDEYISVIKSLNRQRNTYLENQSKKGGLSFDQEVLKGIKRIAKRKNIPLY